MFGKTTPTGESIQNLKKENRGKIVASFDLITSSGIRIPGCTVVDGKNGLFVSVPSMKTERGWVPLLKLPSYVRKELEALVTEELKLLNAPRKKEKEPAWPPPKKSAKAQKEADYLEWKKNKPL